MTQDLIDKSKDKKTMRRGKRAGEILENLNEKQRAATTHLDGPVVVFAGAGSGKTRIITHRIAWLIDSGVAPWEILALTFTNKAAGEMRKRVDDLTPLSSRVLIATFHSACARWLREFAPELGFTSDFTIYDDKDSLSAVKTIIKELNVKIDDEFSPLDYKNAISRLKTMAILPNDERLHKEYIELMPPVGVQIYQRYQEYLQACNAMDFGDLIMNILLLLRRNPSVRSILQKRYRYIMVDEYQDTNRTQFELISWLSERHKNLFVVGDDDQSIYSWRGAIPANIIEFDQTYPIAKKITMEQNYRCSQNIVDAASAMIANNKYRVAKKLFTQNEPGERLTFRLEADNDVEGWYIADNIIAEQDQYDLNEIAIFYRTNSQSRVLEDALRKENIPYKIFGTVRFYDRMEVKDVMAYLKAIINPRDDVSFKRIINTPPRGIGQKAVITIEQEAIKRDIPMWEAVEQMVEESYPRLHTKLRPFLEDMEKLKSAIKTAELDEIVEIILDHTGYFDFLEKRYPDQSLDKMDNIHELGAALADYNANAENANLSNWLQSVTLSSEEGENGNGVSLMTLHMAKGLEYPRVYIAGVEDGLIPHKNSLDDNESLEEERRLFYVGMTRAMRKLTFVGAYQRRIFNQFVSYGPSRFLSEIPSKYFEPITEAEQSLIETHHHQDSDELSYEMEYDYSDGDDSEQLSVGKRVRHPTYGRGRIEQLSQEFGVAKAFVRFDEFGLRKVNLRHLSL